MDPNTRQSVLAAAGAAGGDPLYVDDVFSTYLFEGSSSAVTITNGLDLSGEGGLIWIKSRTSTASHATSSSANNYYGLMTPNTDAADADSTTQYVRGTSTGFEVLYGNITPNAPGADYASWSFRKAPGFFDVVAYTGNGSSTGDSQTISHGLGSTPGFVMIKRTSGTGEWVCWHRSISTGQPRKYIQLNATNGTGSMGADIWGTVNSTGLEVKHNGTVGDSYEINKNGETYVAYFFAHDSQTFGTDEDESIIKCGSISGYNARAELGFEPQFVLLKMTNYASNWILLDVMRGWHSGLNNDAHLFANLTATEADYDGPSFDATGFNYGQSGEDWIYMAIRRPHKPPTVGTEVFKATLQSSSSSFDVGFPTDMVISSYTGSGNKYLSARLTNASLLTDGNVAETTQTQQYFLFDLQNSYQYGAWLGNTEVISYNFKRAPGFFDAVAYSGNNVATNQNHNLGVPPELIITKVRSGPYNRDWNVGPFVTGYSDGYLNLNNSNAGFGNVSTYFPGTPTSAIYGLPGGGNSGTNGTGYTYISYLFATLSGISKVGTYTGTGNAINVDCGFSSGARFILIKRTDATGDWFVYDSARGIVSGNDPYLLFNSTAAEVTNTDYIDPLNSGFTVTSSAPTGLNASGGTYIFLAIA